MKNKDIYSRLPDGKGVTFLVTILIGAIGVFIVTAYMVIRD